jgi:hypothetical protein
MPNAAAPVQYTQIRKVKIVNNAFYVSKTACRRWGFDATSSFLRLGVMCFLD